MSGESGVPSGDPHLASVQVRFERRRSAGLSDRDLDALADALIEIRDVVTVRVEAGDALVVYRIDVWADSVEEAAELARGPVAAVGQRLGLVGQVISIGVV
jgi:hypothetical protein